MKLLKISVFNLYGLFNHEIALNTMEGITLILGQNGLGKTLILKIIKYIFTGAFEELQTIQFDSIALEFDNNSIWEIKYDIDFTGDRNLTINLVEGIFIRHSVSLIDIKRNTTRLTNVLRKYLPPTIRRIDDDEWIDTKTDNKYTTSQLYHRYRDVLPTGLYKDFTVYPEWLSSVIQNQPISLIETQRLLTFIDGPDDFRGKSNTTFKNTVVEYSELLSREINLQLANSSELATKLDRTYPNRLIERLTKTSNISQTDLNNKLNDLEAKRARLEKVGLLDLEKETNLKFIQEQDERIREVLLVYIEDSQKKLEVYDDLADKIELFLKIINERFLLKKLTISKDEGFHFESLKTGEMIPVSSLSSGEQHLLVLYYKLLFILKEGTLLLMDEPEISLHISWQKKIIPDLKNILRLNHMDIIIATHSPAVIGKNWNLAVELNAE